ncbi:hypothetical protein BGX38DRAFT_1215221, partial [Terfezia claveryi]
WRINIDEKVERVEQRLMGEMQKREKRIDQKMEKLEQKMESMEVQLNNRLDTIAAELRRSIVTSSNQKIRPLRTQVIRNDLCGVHYHLRSPKSYLPCLWHPMSSCAISSHLW